MVTPIFFVNKIHVFMLKEFKAFAIQGNLIDTAVAFVMGVAFGKITSAFIDGMIMPLVSTIFQTDFKTWQTELSPEVKDATGKVLDPGIFVKYGDFVAAIINFIVVALVMFLIVKAVAAAKKASEKEAAAVVVAPSPPPAQETLLSEIRDLLKAGR